MPKSYDWSSFYETLCQRGPDLLLGIGDDVREIIAITAETTDTFWSEGMQEQLSIASEEGLRAGVLAALDVWLENVIAALESDFGIQLDRRVVRVDPDSPILMALVAAAQGDQEV